MRSHWKVRLTPSSQSPVAAVSLEPTLAKPVILGTGVSSRLTLSTPSVSVKLLGSPVGRPIRFPDITLRIFAPVKSASCTAAPVIVAPRRSALFNFATFIEALLKSIFLKSNPLKSAPLRFAVGPKRNLFKNLNGSGTSSGVPTRSLAITSLRVASANFVPVTLAPDRFTPLRFIPVRSIPARFAPVRLPLTKLTPVRFRARRSKPLQSQVLRLALGPTRKP